MMRKGDIWMHTGAYRCVMEAYRCMRMHTMHACAANVVKEATRVAKTGCCLFTDTILVAVGGPGVPGR